MINLPPRHAVVIGIDKYEKPIPSLRTAAADARAVADVLRKPYGFNVTHQLVDRDAKLSGIRRMLESLPGVLDAKSHLMFYYAGHGVAESTADLDGPQGFLYPQDARRDDPQSLLSMDELRAALAGLPCHHLLVVLDCCFGGSFRWASTRGLGSDQGQLYDSELRRFLEGAAWQVLTSAAHDEEAADVANYRDKEGERHSPFAAALLAGLAGNADSWRGSYPKDDVITATELYQFVEEDLSQKGWPQTPGLSPLRLENKGEFIFLDPKKEPNTRPDPPLDDSNNPWPEDFGNLWSDEPYEPPAEVGPEELRAIVEEPAAEKALYFEPAELVDELVDETIAMPGALPLLSRTLGEMYIQALLRRRSWRVPDRALNRQDYKTVGGVAGTVRKLANKLLKKADAEDLGATVRRVLLRMVSFEGWTATRRRISRRELVYADSEEQQRVDTVVSWLLERRLVVVFEKPAAGQEADGEQLELAHDALLLSWSPMKDWLKKARDTQPLLRDLWRAATEWDERGVADDGLLWDGDPRLPEVRKRKMRRELNRLEDEFVRASVKRKLREEKEARKAADARRVAVAGMWKELDPTYAALVLLEVEKLDETPGALSGMWDVLAQPLAHSILHGHEDVVVGAAFNADGTQVVTASRDGTARVWSVGSADGPEPVVHSGHQAKVESAAFNADGSKVLTVGGGTARVWSAGVRPADGSGGDVVLQRGASVHSAAFSADGTQVVIADRGDRFYVLSADGSGEPVLEGRHEGIRSVAFNADGTQVVTTGDKTARVWRTDGSGKSVVLEHENYVLNAGIHVDGHRVLVLTVSENGYLWNASGRGKPVVLRRGGLWHVVDAAFGGTAWTNGGPHVVAVCSDNAVRLWRGVLSRHLDEPIVFQHDDKVASAAFSPDGSRVVSASWDRTARVWNVNAPDLPQVLLRGHRARVLSAAFSPDGTEVVTASGDGTARLWTLAGAEGRTTGVPIVLGTGDTVVFNADGSKVLGSRGGFAQVWNVDGTGEPVVLRGHQPGRLESAAFNADGTRVVTAGSDETVRVWNVAGSGEGFVLSGHQGMVRSAAFNADGTKIVTAGETVGVYNADNSGKPVVLPVPWALSAVFSVDGTKIVTSTEPPRVWSADGTLLAELPGERAQSAVFNADGTQVVLSDWGAAWVCNADGSGEPVVLQAEDLSDLVVSAVFNHEGTQVVTASQDHTAQVWNVDGSGKVVLKGHEDGLLSAVFSPDGTKVLTTSRDETARLWNADGSGEPLVWTDVSDAAFSPDGTRVVTAGNRVRVWTIEGAGLKAAIRKATSACLDPEFRVNYLGESPATARRKYEECKNRHKRRPPGATSKPSKPRQPRNT